VIRRAAVAATLALLATSVEAQQCVPSGYPATWPSSWTAYTALATGIEDLVKGPDGSYGTPPEPDNVDIFNGTSGTLPSLYWAFDSSSQVLFFRQRLQGDPRQPADPSNFKQYTWTTNLDLDGDGFSDFLVQVNGFDDTVQVLYDADDDNLYDPSACATGGDIVFEVATITTTQVTDQTGSGGGYLLDWQLPLCAFSTCNNGAQILTETTPFSLAFTTSTNEGNPTLKDGGFPGDYKTASDQPLPGGDTCSLAGGCVQRHWIGDRTATCNGSPTTSVDLTAYTLDALQVDDSASCPDPDGCVVDTIASVKFEYKQVQASQEDPPSPWVEIATVTMPDADPNIRSGLSVNSWSTTWDITGLDTSVLYWVRITVTDDQGNTNSFDPDVDGNIPGQFHLNLVDCSIVPLPVSLAWVRSRFDGESTRIEWATATEAGNLGFQLYGLSDGRWHRLHSELVRSKAVDSTEPLRYELEVTGRYQEVLVTDVDIFGRSRERGPFKVGQEYGSEPVVRPVDWQLVRRGLRRARPSKSAATTRQPEALRLYVEQDGIYRVTYEQLAAAGLDLAGVPTRLIALTNAGAPVPITVRHESAEPRLSRRGFGPGWSVEFYGEALDDLYTASNVYRLTVDADLARRTSPLHSVARASRPTVARRAMATVQVEHDRAYSFSAPNGDPWYDERLLAYNTPERWSFSLEVDELEEHAGTSTLELELWGWTDFGQEPDHHVRIFLNGELVADELFDGLRQMSFEIALPEGLLAEGDNTLEIELPGDTGAEYDLVALDAYGVRYPRRLWARDGRLEFESDGDLIEIGGLPDGSVVAYRIDHEGPVLVATRRINDLVQVNGNGRLARYAVAAETALAEPRLEPVPPAEDITSGSADYLIIAHPLFLDGLDELVAARSSDGLSVRLVDVDQVYEQFHHGVFGAVGIAEYIRYAASNMGTRFVLLVGGDTYDYFDRLGLGSVSFIPTPWMATHHVVRFAPTDPAYGDCDGDRVPEVAVGRLPVRTTDELASAISKILWYDSNSYQRTAVFAADRVDGDLSFAEMSDDLIAGFELTWTIDRAYMDELDRDGARQMLTDSINSGVALTSFVGHSSLTAWSFDKLFESADASALENHGWPTVVVQWGCWNTYHTSPRVSTLGDAFMTDGDHGAAAVLGATALTEVASDRLLSSLLLERLAVPGTTLGEAMVAAKSELASANPYALDVLLGWTLLGDPAMVVVEP
jgi:hypothetical protein